MSFTGNQFSPAQFSGTELGILETLPIGILILNNDFLPVYSNQNLFHFNLFVPANFDENGLPEIPVDLFISSDEKQNLLSGHAVEKNFSSTKAIDGSQISLVLKAVPLADEHAFNGVVILIEDLKIPEDKNQRGGKLIENYFESILNRIWSLFLLVSGDGKIIVLGGKKLKHFLKKQTAKPDSLYDVFLPEYESKILASFKGAILKKQTEEIILEIPGYDDKDAEYYECAIAHIPSDKIRSGIAFISIREITTFLKMIENYRRELTELQQYYDYTQEITEAVFVFNRQGRISFWNKASEKIFRLRRSEVFGKNITKVLPVFSESVVESIAKSSSKELAYTFDSDISLIDGDKKSIVFQCFVNQESDSSSFIIIASDYTPMKEGETAIKSLLTVMTSYFKHHRNPAFLLSNEGKILVKNEAFTQVFAERVQDSTDIYLLDLMETGFVVDHDITFHALSQKTDQQQVVPFTVAPNKLLVFSFVLSSIENSGNELKYMCTLQDVTNQQLIHAEVELLRGVFDNSNDGIAVEQNNQFIQVNDAFARLFGYDSRSELEGSSWTKIVAEEELHRIKEYSEKRLTSDDAPHGMNL